MDAAKTILTDRRVGYAHAAGNESRRCAAHVFAMIFKVADEAAHVAPAPNPRSGHHLLQRGQTLWQAVRCNELQQHGIRAFAVAESPVV